MECGAAEATDLALFVLLSSTLVCCQPTELIRAFLLHNFSYFTCFCSVCVFVIWLLSSFSVGWSFRLFGS